MTKSSKYKTLSIYIHIPFCKAKCHYCAFASFTKKQDSIPSYIDKLIEEIEAKSKLTQDYQIETIYIGGGTPSLIEPKYIEYILNTIKKNYRTITNPEITIESNPESVSSKKVEQYLAYGINRFSVGCQSLNNQTLQAIGRIHSKKEILNVVKIFQQLEVKNFSLDFIMGLPHQTISLFKKDLQEILSWNPPHLSFYFLSLDTKRINKFIKDCPQEEEQIEMYEHLTSTLGKAGYHHYEVSNYAIPGHECRHNLRYWQQQEYLGFGLSAHSYFDKAVFYNTSNLENYFTETGKPIDSLKIDNELIIMDLIMLNLRTSQGIDLKSLPLETQKTIIEKAKPFIESEHLQLNNNHLSATKKGFLILDTIVDTLTTF